MRRLGIMGGVFDPVHNGHLAAAEAAREHYELEKVIFVPSARPPHRKQPPVASPEDRYVMTALATASNRSFAVSRVELDRPGPSYAIDTVKAFQELWRPEGIYFITGFDAVTDIASWKSSQELMGLCRFIAVARPGFTDEDPCSRLPEACRGSIDVLTVQTADISSTMIRDRIRAGSSVRYLVPDAVYDYMVRESIYTG